MTEFHIPLSLLLGLYKIRWLISKLAFAWETVLSHA